MIDYRPAPITVLCVDEHILFRMGIASAVNEVADLRLVAEAENGRDALQMQRRYRPDVTLMDIRLHDMNGIDVITAIRDEFPESRVVVLTAHDGDVLALHAVKAGASAYLLKLVSPEELLATLRAVHLGRRYVPRQVTAMLGEGAGSRQLSKREVEVLRLVAVGNSNREVGAHLGLAEETIKIHIKSILSKLDANDRTHAVTLAIESGTIEANLNRRRPASKAR